MSISLAPSVETEPYVKLSRWMLIEDARVIRYFVGRCEETNQCRISSAIRYFDPQKRRGTTFSGRVYALVGEAGIDGEIQQVLERWLALNHISTWTDVSDELMAFIAAADPARARAFYEGVLGLRFVADEPFALIFDCGGTTLRVQKVPAVTPPAGTARSSTSRRPWS